jgi:hypothetical protein
MRWRRWMAVEDGCEWLPLIRVSREAPWCGAAYLRTASGTGPTAAQQTHGKNHLDQKDNIREKTGMFISE